MILRRCSFKDPLLFYSKIKKRSISFLKNLLRVLDKYTAVVVCVLIALLVFYSEYDKIQIKNEDDLTTISGTLINYSFLDNLSKNGKHYTLNLAEYDNNFQIFADHIQLFKKKEFKKMVSIGSSISIKIPREHMGLLNLSDERIMIAGIRVSDIEYLNPQQVILKEKDVSGYLAGFGLLLVAFLAFVVKYKDLI